MMRQHECVAVERVSVSPAMPRIEWRPIEECRSCRSVGKCEKREQKKEVSFQKNDCERLVRSDQAQSRIARCRKHRPPRLAPGGRGRSSIRTSMAAEDAQGLPYRCVPCCHAESKRVLWSRASSYTGSRNAAAPPPRGTGSRRESPRGERWRRR